MTELYFGSESPNNLENYTGKSKKKHKKSKKKHKERNLTSPLHVNADEEHVVEHELESTYIEAKSKKHKHKKKHKKHKKGSVDSDNNLEVEESKSSSVKKKRKHKESIEDYESGVEMKEGFLETLSGNKKRKHEESITDRIRDMEMNGESRSFSPKKNKKKHKQSIIHSDNEIEEKGKEVKEYGNGMEQDGEMNGESKKTFSPKKNKKKHKQNIIHSDIEIEEKVKGVKEYENGIEQDESNKEIDVFGLKTHSTKKKKHRKSILDTSDSEMEKKEEDSRLTVKKKKHKKDLNSDNEAEVKEEELTLSVKKKKKSRRRNIGGTSIEITQEMDSMEKDDETKSGVETGIEVMQRNHNISDISDHDSQHDEGRNEKISDERSSNELELNGSDKDTNPEDGEKCRTNSKKKNKKARNSDKKQSYIKSDTEIQKNESVMKTREVVCDNEETSDEEYQNLVEEERGRTKFMQNLNLGATQVKRKKSEPKRCSVEEVDRNVLEILHRKNDVSYRNYKKDLAHFKQIGLKINSGKWTFKEDEKLRENWRIFFEEHPFPEDKRYFLLAGKECTLEEKTEFRQFKSAYNFYIRLGEGIQRLLYSVYVRARYLFNPIENKGKFTEDETKELELLSKEYSNDWKIIGDSLERTAQAVCTKFKSMKEDQVTGKWEKWEHDQLIKAVKEVMDTEDISHLYYDLPWTKIAEKMPTRNLLQCRWYWLNKVQWQMNSPDPHAKKAKFSKQDQASLISLITDMKPAREAEIDWVFLMERFENAGSPQFIKAKWYKLRSKVPNYKVKSFDEILDYLVETILPELKDTKRTLGLGKEYKKK